MSCTNDAIENMKDLVELFAHQINDAQDAERSARSMKNEAFGGLVKAVATLVQATEKSQQDKNKNEIIEILRYEVCFEDGLTAEQIKALANAVQMPSNKFNEALSN